MNDDYLWDGSGTTDPDVAYFERWAGGFGHDEVVVSTGGSIAVRPSRRGRTRRRARGRRGLGFAPGLLLGAAAALVLLWLGLRDESSMLSVDGNDAPEQSLRVTESAESTPAQRASARPSAGLSSAPVTRPELRHPIESMRFPSMGGEDITAAAGRRAAASSRARRAKQTERPSPSMPTNEQNVGGRIYDQLALYGHAIPRCFREHSTAPKGALVHMVLGIDRQGAVVDARLGRHNMADDAQGRATGACIATVLERMRVPPADPPLETHAVFFHPGPEPSP